MEFQLSFLIEEFCCSLKCSFQVLFRLQMINQNILEDSCYFNYLFLCKLVELNKKREAFFCAQLMEMQIAMVDIFQDLILFHVEK
jgi:hypothetical protein